MSIDQQLNSAFEPIATTASNIIFYSIPIYEGVELKLILAWIVSIAVFLTIYLGFINIRCFKHALHLAFNKNVEPDAKGEISRFQALMTSLSGSVGLGNISGVAIAISLGGPGALFWMIMLAMFGMTSKFAEVTLGVKYRTFPNKHDPSEVSGGPMHYLKVAFEKRGLPRVGSVFAGFFAICCVLGAIGGGNMYQSNQAYEQLVNVTGGEGSFLDKNAWLFGLVLASLVAAVIIGGIKSIANVASKLVPTMGIIYMIAGLVVIALNIQSVPEAATTIIQSAFAPGAQYGGLLGAILVGTQRAFFSNEAGLGSAAIVHSAVKTNSPVSQGLVAMLGPFVDTIIICTTTALVIVITKEYMNFGDGIQGISMTSAAFESAIPGFKYMLTLTVFLFAFSTMITWSYYGSQSIAFFFGAESHVETAFKVFFCLCVIVGATANLENMISFTDAAIFSLAIPNIIALYMFAPELKRDLKEYIQSIKEKG